MRKKHSNWILIIVILLLILLGTIFLALSLGEVNFSFSQIIDILTKKDGVEYSILSNIRIPRIVLGIAVGGSLSISGLILQGIYRNPLVEPYTLGISGGAALGVSLAIVLGIQHIFQGMTLPVFGILGSLSMIVILYFISLRKQYVNINTVLLTGVMISFMTSSLIMFIMATTTSENLQSIVFWTMGSLEEPNMFLVKTVFISSVLGLILIYFFAGHLNALRLGETNARYLGIDSTATIRILFVFASVLTGISVAVAGIIGFVGLIIPHLIRYFVGADFRILIISSFLGGAVFLIASDIIARTIIAPNELPIGVITGIIGGAIFIVALSKSKNKI